MSQEAATSTSSAELTAKMQEGIRSVEEDSDWADQVTNLVVDSVDKVRDRTTGPILEYSRASVHLVVALLVALPMALLMVLGMVRLLTWATGHAWISYTIMGVVLIGIGAALWSKRSKLPL